MLMLNLCGYSSPTVYYVVVTHRSGPWAEEGDQGYALVVELFEEERVDVDRRFSSR
jgi:hypothetical protein